MNYCVLTSVLTKEKGRDQSWVRYPEKN